MGFIGGIVAGELWRVPVAGSTGTFQRFEEAAGLAGGLTDGGGMIHGAMSRSSKKCPPKRGPCRLASWMGRRFSCLSVAEGCRERRSKAL
jgi:hypothetical protein